MAVLRYDPEEAAKIVAARLASIKSNEAIVADIAKRYAPIPQFAKAIEEAGLKAELDALVARRTEVF